MFLSTLPSAPVGHKIVKEFGVIFYVHRIESSSKGIIRGMLEQKRNDYQEGLDTFVAQAGGGANAILGMQVTSTSQSFRDATYLYLTFVGSPVEITSH